MASKKKVVPPVYSDPTLPADYEACGDCGFDHTYEPVEAHRAHMALKFERDEERHANDEPLRKFRGNSN